jgi:hypothetical protein
MIAQPGVALLEEYPLQQARGGAVPPVEQAILQGLGRLTHRTAPG